MKSYKETKLKGQITKQWKEIKTARAMRESRPPS